MANRISPHKEFGREDFVRRLEILRQRIVNNKDAEGLLYHNQLWWNFLAQPNSLNVIADDLGYFIKVNMAWEIITGWTSDEMKAIPFLDLIHPDDLQRTKDQYSKNIEDPDKINNISFRNRYRCKNGDYIWLEWTPSLGIDRGYIVASAFVIDSSGSMLDMKR